MNTQRIALICDSGCDVPYDFATEHDIRIIPLTLNYSDATYQSGIDITTEEVIRKFAEEIPTTSLPSPITIQTVFEKAREDGYTKAIYIGISSALSSTLQTTMMVGDTIEGLDICYIDTRNIGVGAALTVISAAQMIDEGLPFESIRAKLEYLAANTSIYFAVQTLTYLHKGGRISDTVYRLGSMLNIKPILTCSAEGTYVMTKKSRGMEKALSAEVSMTASRMKEFNKAHIGVCCTSQYDVFDKVDNLLIQKLDSKIGSIIHTNISPALVVHTGPELVGIAAQPDWHDLP